MARSTRKSRSRSGSSSILFALVGMALAAAAAWFGPGVLNGQPAPDKTETASTGPSDGGDDNLAGVASVIDGDTLDIHGERIRLVGVDAPESKQQCLDASGGFYRCGQVAANALDQWIAGNTVVCVSEGKDRYGRTLGECTVRGDSVQDWLVTHGHAVAYRSYSKKYIPAEEMAHASKAGIWAGEFVEPAKWRKGERLAGEATKASAP